MDEGKLPELDLLVATFGPPGSGKSTVCRAMAESLAVTTISPGRELRRLASRGGPVGSEAEKLIRKAAPAPDDMLWWMLTEHGSGALILDGVPQNIDQVSLLKDFAAHYGYRLAGVHLLVPKEVALDRIASRWYCAQCRQPYSHGKPSCDCGATPYRRLDDTIATTVTARLRRYECDVSPAAAKFSALFPYREFDASNKLQDVLASVTGWVETLRNGAK